MPRRCQGVYLAADHRRRGRCPRAELHRIHLSCPTSSVFRVAEESQSLRSMETDSRRRRRRRCRCLCCPRSPVECCPPRPPPRGSLLRDRALLLATPIFIICLNPSTPWTRTLHQSRKQSLSRLTSRDCHSGKGVLTDTHSPSTSRNEVSK